MKIEIIKDKRKLNERVVSVLLIKLATAESKDVVAISKELKYWSRKLFNRRVNLHQ